MAKDVGDAIGAAIGHAAREVVETVSANAKKGSRKPQLPQLSGGRGMAAGAGLVALVPLAAKGAGKVVHGLRNGAALAAAVPLARKAAGALRDGSVDEAIADLRRRVDDWALDDEEEAGANGADEPAAEEPDGAGGDEAGEVRGSGEGDDAGEDRDGSGGPQATGEGRRMPIQQAVDVAVPLETAYNQFTQFESWPQFMHRVTRVTQEDDASIGFATKIWGKTKEFKAQIDTQRPDERIRWKVSQGITHAGVVTFHELAPSLTRIEVTLDVDPGSLIEKAARGMRHVKRALRADLHRFKAFIEMRELETGAWRGVIDGGEVIVPHDEQYDDERDYSDLEDEDPSPPAASEEDGEADEETDEEHADERPEARANTHDRFSRPGRNGRGEPERVGSGGGRRR